MISKRQAVETNFDGMNAGFIEPKVNTEASEYIAEHFEEIRRQVRKMGIHADYADDLLADVWQSIREGELNGNGYDVSYSNEGDVITVAEFIFGRIKGYSMNVKYRPEVMERRISKDSTRSIEIISASATDTSDLDKLDNFQKAYALAPSYDDLDAVEAEMSLRSNIEFCMGFDDEIGFHIVNLFKNIDKFASIGFNSSLFDKLKEACNYHDEFGAAFKDVMSIAQTCKPIFESVVESF